jgi:hypothetical protein
MPRPAAHSFAPGEPDMKENPRNQDYQDINYSTSQCQEERRFLPGAFFL